jgi:hypothetical protein
MKWRLKKRRDCIVPVWQARGCPLLVARWAGDNASYHARNWAIFYEVPRHAHHILVASSPSLLRMIAGAAWQRYRDDAEARKDGFELYKKLVAEVNWLAGFML